MALTLALTPFLALNLTLTPYIAPYIMTPFMALNLTLTVTWDLVRSPGPVR